MEGTAHTAAKDEQVAAVGERDRGVARARRWRLAGHVRRVLAPLPAAHLQRVHLRRPPWRQRCGAGCLSADQRCLTACPSACRFVLNTVWREMLAPLQLTVGKE